MSGHSKFANIKHKKEKTDAQRGKIFTKLGREISVAVREGGGGDPETNGKLRDVIAKCKANNMPNDNIMRSIKRAAGDSGGIIYEEVLYEGYGSNGVAVIVEVLTDNRNRSASDVRHTFDKYGGSLGSSGCVSYLFDRKGVILIEHKPGLDEDTVLMDALDAGASDVVPSDEVFEVYTEMEDFSAVREGLEAKGYVFMSAELDRIPQTMAQLPNEEACAKIQKLIDMLEDLDDVQQVYHNADLPEEEEEE